MKIRIVTLGCKLNFAESSALMNTLIAKGHTRAKQGEPADVVIVNTCTVTDTADHKDRQAIHRLKRENPNARIIVTGCYARLKPEEIAQMVEVDHVVLKRDDTFQPAYSKDDRTRCFLKVQDGCNYFCTYCTIPMARGRSRNPYIKDIVAQAQHALDDGAKEIILTGVNIGDFGRSTGESFIDLLHALDNLQPSTCNLLPTTYPLQPTPYNLLPTTYYLQPTTYNLPPTTYYLQPTTYNLPPAYRIRISSCEPNLLTDDIIDFVAHSRHFAPHFHIPLQSGNNEVLKIMHRHYTRELFQERIEHIKAVMPHAFIGVDCMVGVRGETQERFEDYVQFISALPVNQLHVFTYSERANTRMLEMDLYVVPQRERERRSKVLHTISEQKLADFYAQNKGKKVTVLWESKKDGNKMYGFSENYIKVAGPYDKSKINTFEQIVLS